MADNRPRTGLLTPGILHRLALIVCTFTLIGCEEPSRTPYDPYAAGAAATHTATFAWPEGKKAALSLTFDDARLSQPDVGIPLLNRYRVKGTFYVTPAAVERRLDAWKDAVAAGHEIANHTLVHPCSANFTWSRDKAVEGYDLAKIAAEIDEADRQIEALLGVTPTTFAYPCGHTFVGRGVDTKSYVPVVAQRFLVGRCAFNEIGNDPLYCDLAQATGVSMDELDFLKVKAMIEQAAAEGRWLILFGHEIGPAARQTVPSQTLEAICRYANDPANGVWLDTVENIGKYILEQRQGK